MAAASLAVADYSRFTRWHVMPDMESLVNAVSIFIYRAARQAIAARRSFRMVLAGGATPRAVYRELADTDADWARWQVYFGDECCLPVQHPARNSVMAAANWLDYVSIPPDNIHVIPAERGAVAAARMYATLIDAARPFDLVLPGMGEDGQTAGLFPGQRHGTVKSVQAVAGTPGRPADRVSLSSAALNDTAMVLALVTGMAKHHAVQRWQRGEDLPIAHIHGRCGIDVYLDPAAAYGPPHLAQEGVGRAAKLEGSVVTGPYCQ